MTARRTTHRSILALVLVLMLALAASPTLAVVNGEEDGTTHPYVALLVFTESETNWWTCSGALINPTVILTANHCTSPTAQVEAWFNPDMTNYAVTRSTRAADATGRSVSMPNGTPEEPNRYIDVGLVLLDQPITMSRYAEIAPADFLDNQGSTRGSFFTVVGYGINVQRQQNSVRSWGLRKQAGLQMIDNNEVTARFNPARNAPVNAGSACSGDSGGPIFYQNTNQIVGVVSTGMNWTCSGGPGTYYRVDTELVRTWVNRYL